MGGQRFSMYTQHVGHAGQRLGSRTGFRHEPSTYLGIELVLHLPPAVLTEEVVGGLGRQRGCKAPMDDLHVWHPNPLSGCLRDEALLQRDYAVKTRTPLSCITSAHVRTSLTLLGSVSSVVRSVTSSSLTGATGLQPGSKRAIDTCARPKHSFQTPPEPPRNSSTPSHKPKPHQARATLHPLRSPCIADQQTQSHSNYIRMTSYDHSCNFSV
jgi:hypothetical protein